jgi:replication factor C subunit 2/4
MQVPLELVEKLITACKQPAFAAVEGQVRDVFSEGYSINAVLERLLANILDSSELSDAQKGKAVSAMATADRRLVDGADGVLQLLHVMSVLQQVYHCK